MTHILDDYALNSHLREKNNWLKIYIAFFGIVVSIFSISFITPFFIALCTGIATVHFGKVPVNAYLKLLTVPAGFVLVTAVVIALFSTTGSEIISIELLGQSLSLSTGGLHMGLLVLARAIGATSCLFFLSLSTPMIELFSVLKTTRFPDSFIEISMMMYRYIFVFLDVAIGIKYAQEVRLGYRDFKTSLRSMGMLGTNLFIRSWEQGEKLYLSMNSRCYDGKMILLEEKRPVRMPEVLLTCSYFALVLAVFYLTRGITLI